MRNTLIKMLYENYSTGVTFKLASGKTSNFYMDCKPVTLDPNGMYLIGMIIYNEIKNDKIKGIGGLTFGADPMAITTSFVSGTHFKPIQAFSIRKNIKDHGTGKWIEGKVNPGDNVVIVDDVVTTGNSTIEAIKKATIYGLNVVKVVVLFDRQEGGIENIKKYVSDVISIVNRDDLIKYGEEHV
jgi:orotate phosphoribosyltransferase